MQKRKIRQYEARRVLVSPEPLHYEQPVQDGHATLLSAYNIVSHDNPSYLLSNNRNNHSSLPEYQNSSVVEARVSATNHLYANTEVDTTMNTLLESEAQSNTSTLTYDYIPRSIQ